MVRKRKPNGYIYTPGSQYRESKDYLKLRFCSHEAITNSALSIRKYIDKHELYR